MCLKMYLAHCLLLGKFYNKKEEEMGGDWWWTPAKVVFQQYGGVYKLIHVKKEEKNLVELQIFQNEKSE